MVWLVSIQYYFVRALIVNANQNVQGYWTTNNHPRLLEASQIAYNGLKSSSLVVVPSQSNQTIEIERSML